MYRNIEIINGYLVPFCFFTYNVKPNISVQELSFFILENNVIVKDV